MPKRRKQHRYQHDQHYVISPTTDGRFEARFADATYIAKTEAAAEALAEKAIKKRKPKHPNPMSKALNKFRGRKYDAIAEGAYDTPCPFLTDFPGYEWREWEVEKQSWWGRTYTETVGDYFPISELQERSRCA